MKAGDNGLWKIRRRFFLFSFLASFPSSADRDAVGERRCVMDMFDVLWLFFLYLILKLFDKREKTKRTVMITDAQVS